MGKVIFDITASLDGFVAGPNDGPENPMGDGGMRLFDWYFSDSETSRSPEAIEPEIRDEATRTIGALVGGRRLYDNAHGWNGEHPLHVPFFIVTHHAPEVTGEINGSFVTDGVESAVKQAQAATGDKAVAVASPDIAQQCLKAGCWTKSACTLCPCCWAAASAYSTFRTQRLLSWNARRRATPKKSFI